jgi:hypothetical protein
MFTGFLLLLLHSHKVLTLPASPNRGEKGGERDFAETKGGMPCNFQLNLHGSGNPGIFSERQWRGSRKQGKSVFASESKTGIIFFEKKP